MYRQKEIDKNIEIGLGIVGIKFLIFLKNLAKIIFGIPLLGLITFFKLARSKNRFYNFAKSSKKKFLFLLTKDIFFIAIAVINVVAIIKFTNTLNLLDLKYLLFFVLLGLIAKIKYLILAKFALRARDKWFAKFEKINFKDSNGKFPDYLATIKYPSKQQIIFDSYIPIEDWKIKKSFLNQIFNCEVDINLYENNFMQKVITKPLKPLPNFIKFDESKHLSNEDKKILIGLDKFSNNTYMDFNQFPHWSIGGDTGSGKSTLLKLIYTGLKKQNKKMVLIDLKGLTLKHFKKYEQHKIVYDDIDKVLSVLKKIEIEHDKRLALFKSLDKVEDLQTYNQIQNKKMPEIFLLIDEIARVTVDFKGDKRTKQIVDILKKLAQLGRSQGFYLIFISQRPDADTIDPKIRACLGGKISGPFKDKNTAEMAINDRNAFENFPEVKGRMLILSETTKQFQGLYIKNEDLDKIFLSNLQKENTKPKSNSIIYKLLRIIKSDKIKKSK